MLTLNFEQLIDLGYIVEIARDPDGVMTGLTVRANVSIDKDLISSLQEKYPDVEYDIVHTLASQMHSNLFSQQLLTVNTHMMGRHIDWAQL